MVNESTERLSIAFVRRRQPQLNETGGAKTVGKTTLSRTTLATKHSMLSVSFLIVVLRLVTNELVIINTTIQFVVVSYMLHVRPSLTFVARFNNHNILPPCPQEWLQSIADKY